MRIRIEYTLSIRVHKYVHWCCDTICIHYSIYVKLVYEIKAFFLFLLSYYATFDDEHRYNKSNNNKSNTNNNNKIIFLFFGFFQTTYTSSNIFNHIDKSTSSWTKCFLNDITWNQDFFSVLFVVVQCIFPS